MTSSLMLLAMTKKASSCANFITLQTFNLFYMPKSNWGLPAYVGRPSPLKAANRVMLVMLIILIAGFIKAGLRENWFEPIVDFVMH